MEKLSKEIQRVICLDTKLRNRLKIGFEKS